MRTTDRPLPQGRAREHWIHHFPERRFAVLIFGAPDANRKQCINRANIAAGLRFGEALQQTFLKQDGSKPATTLGPEQGVGACRKQGNRAAPD
jgi:hypothetical protein